MASSSSSAIDRMHTCTNETIDSDSDFSSSPSSCHHHHHHRHHHRHSYVVFRFPTTFCFSFLSTRADRFVKIEVVIRPPPSMPYLVLHYSYLVTLSPKTPPSPFPASPLPLISIGEPPSTCSMLAITSPPTPPAPVSPTPITPTTGVWRSPGAAPSSPSHTTSQNQMGAAPILHHPRPPHPRRYRRPIISASHSARPSPPSPPCAHQASRSPPMHPHTNSSPSPRTSSRVVSFTCRIPRPAIYTHHPRGRGVRRPRPRRVASRARASSSRSRRRCSSSRSAWMAQRIAASGPRGPMPCSTRCTWRRTSTHGVPAWSRRVGAAGSPLAVPVRTSSRTPLSAATGAF